jgi:hypothetical protein
MTEPRTGIPLAEGLSCTLDSTQEHPERFLTILGGEKPLPLSKVQALALCKLMLSSLGQIVGEEMFNDPLLSQVNLVQAFHGSIEWLEERSQTELEKEESFKEAYEQYQHTLDLQEEMMDAVEGWEVLLERQLGKLEEAAEELGISLDELEEQDEDELDDDELVEQDEYELDDELDEHPDAT